MKRLLALVFLIQTVLLAFAGQVDLPKAQAIAQHFMLQHRAHGRMMASQATDVRLAYQQMGSIRVSQPVYYVFNSERGFVIVAGDDRAQEILAYGSQPLDMNMIPENMRFWLGYYQKQMEYLQEHTGLVVQKPIIKDGQSVEPMLEAMWNQGYPYFSQCPQDGDTRALTGCACTSLAQVFYFWQYPTEPTPEVPGYTTKNGKFTLEALPSATFDWDNILPTYNFGDYTQNDAHHKAIAQLMRYIGQAEQMNYDKAGSDAWETDIVRACEMFGYEEAEAVYKATITENGEETIYINDEDWAEIMIEELMSGRPMVFCAFDYSYAYQQYNGHAFNVDGYDATTGNFSINWGWSGVGNGYFAMNAFANQGSNYHLGQRIVRNIKPSTAVVPTIKVTPESLTFQTRINEPETATFTVKGRLLTGDITLTLTDAADAFTLDATLVSIDDAKDGKVITVTYNPTEVGSNTATITLTSEGAEEKTVTLNGAAQPAPLVVVDPVMLPANEQYINKTSFRADWTDETAVENVASYTLELSTKPNYVLLDEVDWSNTIESFSAQTANAANYFPAGWTFAGSDLWAEDGYISINGNFSFSTPSYNVGADKITVVFTAKSGYPSATFTVSTSVDSKEFPLTERTFVEYRAILNCAEADKITIANNSGNPGFLNMKVYAGEVPAPQLRATEEGDATHRLITGISERFYTINNLTAEGTFLYKVKALYIDGTESKWSNVEEVTLKENGTMPEVLPGDVNDDGEVSIADVTVLIDYLLGSEPQPFNEANANIDGGDISISDVTALIDILLSAN